MPILPFDSTAYSTYTGDPGRIVRELAPLLPEKTGSQANLQGGKSNTAETNKADIQGDIYKLLISGIVPRPITFVFTIDEEDMENLTPFVSRTTRLSSHSHATTALRAASKTKIANLKNSQGFTVNIISELFVENANATAIDGFDEWTIGDLTKSKCVRINASRVKESAFSMECEISPTQSQASIKARILAHVKYIHMCKDVLTGKGVIDLTKSSLSRV
ncbi:hypothetical protein F4604DRAFT_1899651 [Suillus subluteus]|nr:hypothetical protein F4604DRAFT_1899651 [Suillus subluteus]